MQNMNSKGETDGSAKKKQKAQYNDVMSVQIRHCSTAEPVFSLLKQFNALLNQFLGIFADNVTYHHIFE